MGLAPHVGARRPITLETLPAAPTRRPRPGDAPQAGRPAHYRALELGLQDAAGDGQGHLVDGGRHAGRRQQLRHLDAAGQSVDLDPGEAWVGGGG
jgi:hypothetical protein